MQQTPDTARVSRVRRVLYVLALVTLVVTVMYFAQDLLVPITFAALIAMLLEPVVRWLTPRIGRGAGIAVVVGSLALVVALAVAALGYQISEFAAEWPRIQEQLVSKSENLQRSAAEVIGVSPSTLDTKVEEQLTEVQNASDERAGTYLTAFGGFLADLLLFYVYLALVLLEAPRLQRFVVRRVSGEGGEREAERTLAEVRRVSGKYLWGRFLLIVILLVLYSAGFYFGGLRFAIVVAGIGALLSLIPYLGGIIAAIIVVGVAALSDDFGSVALWALGTLAVAQFIESYVITPFLIGKEVSLNPLATVIAVIGMGSVWGIGGAILAIPIVAMLRQVLEHLPGGADYAYLLSNRKDDTQ